MSLNKLDPSKLNSWKELKTQFDKEEFLTIEKLMEESDRLKNFSVEWEDLFLDFTKNRISQSTLNLLIKLCHESDLKNNIECYFNGVVINETEKRSVLHTALRSQKNESEEIDKVVNDIRQKIINIADKVINGDKTGYTGKKFTDVVNIGIGGSHLGQEMVVEGLSPFSQNIKTHFVSNIDPDYTAKVLEKLNPETTLFIIVSKSFNTIETINNANKIKDWFIGKTNVKSIQDHFIAVSNNISAPKDFGVDANNILPIPEWVGGRFSLWGSAGLIIAITLGSENYRQLLNGANSMDKHFRESDFEKNIPVLLALISIWYNNFFKCQTEAIIPYSELLNKLPGYLQQASMESNGKGTDRNNQKVNYETGGIIWGATGTNAQHSFFQLLHQGTKLIPCDFIAFQNPLSEDAEQHKILTANFLAQTNALMSGNKTKESYKNIEGNKPSNSLFINSLTPYNLGMLTALYENKIFTVGSILNIFSFDQWGVELGKSIAKGILDGNTDSLDVSTKNLLTKYKKGK
jgi:glucose-6-phosphate isomerase